MIVYYVLYIHKTYYMERLRELFGVVYNYLFDMVCEILTRINGDAVAAVDTRALYVLHNAWDNEILAVTDSVDLNLRTHHILIDKHGVFKLRRGDYLHILVNVAVAVRDYHILPTENVTRTEQNGITQLVRDFERLLCCEYCFSLGARNSALFQQLVKQLSVLRRVDIRRLCAKYAHSHFGEVFG